MTTGQQHSPRFTRRQLAARFWHSALGSWHGPSAFMAWTLTLSLVVLIIVQLIVQYRINFWNRDFFNDLQQRNSELMWREVRLFMPLVAASAMLTVTAVWGRMMAQRRWRRWLTKHVINHWLENGRYRRLKLVEGEYRNAEFRIAEDVRMATEAPIDLGFGLLTSLLTALVFLDVLWTVGGNLTIEWNGFAVTVPGYLVSSVIIYSFLLSSAMRIIGRNLTRVIEQKNQAEAEFLAGASRMREIGDADTPSAGTRPETHTLMLAFDRVFFWWRRVSRELMNTTLISHVNFLVAPVAAWMLCAPKYLAGTMSLGELAQVYFAFITLQVAFNWLVDNYPRLADWLAAVNRVAELLLSLDAVAQADEDKAAGVVRTSLARIDGVAVAIAPPK